jgi:hypothetical protein
MPVDGTDASCIENDAHAVKQLLYMMLCVWYYIHMHTGPNILAVPSDVSVGKPVCMFAVCTVTSTSLNLMLL